MRSRYLLLIALLAAIHIERSQQIAVMSVDLGNEFFKIAVVKPGVPMEIVLNKESQRKTPSAIFIGPDDERAYAEAANSKGIRKPHLRYANLLSLLGKNSSHPSVAEFKEMYPFYDLVEDAASQTMVFRVKSDDQEKIFRPEELVGMMLEYAKMNVEDFSEQKVKSAVITVPVHFGQLERKAILRSANLAGLSVLQLMNDNAATALQLGLIRLQQFSDTPRFYVIFDLGSSHATASVVSLEKSKARDDGEIVEHVMIRGVASSTEISTTHVHRAVRNALLSQYEADTKIKNKPDIRKNFKALGKLQKEASRVVHILSANSAVGAHVEGLVDEIDFSGHLTRAELEEVCADIFAKVPDLIGEALYRANVGAEIISEIVLMGAGTRIPKVQEILKISFPKVDLGKGLNTDEAAALGSVYQAAHLSKGFKVKRIVIRDSVIYPVVVEFDRISDNVAKEDAGIVRRTLFDVSNPFPQKKLITFGKHSDDFVFNVTFGGNIDPTWIVSVHGVGDAFAKHSEKVAKGVKAHFAMDDSGILHLRSMEAVFEAEEEEKVVEKEAGGIFSGIGDKLKGLFNSENNATNGTASEDDSTGDETNDSLNNEKNNDTETNTGKEDADKATEKVTIQTKTVTYKENLTFTIDLMFGNAFPEEELTKSKDKMKEFRKKDELRLKLAKMRNDLEAGVIDIKMKLDEDEAKKYISEDEWNTIYAKAKEVGDWLDEEAGPFTTLEEYTEKQTDVHNTVNSWFERLRQAKERPKSLEAIKDSLNHSETFLAGIKVVCCIIVNIVISSLTSFFTNIVQCEYFRRTR